MELRRTLLMASLSIALFMVASPSAWTETTQSPNARTSAKAPGLPLCVDDPKILEEITSTQKANSKNVYKYDGYKKALSTASGEELQARLIYAETMAANCPGQETEVLPLIAQTIGNRVRLRKGDIGSVIFQRDQFASSLNLYSESHYQEFLCPKNSELWAQALAASRGTGKVGDLPADTVNYYLYKHSSRFTPPDWKLPEAKPAKSKTELTSCIRFFRNANWK